MALIELQCQSQGVIDMGHEVFQSWGGEACMAQPSCQSFCLQDSETFLVRPPCGGELGSEVAEEVLGSVDR
jgi:hypothetical protein